MFRVILYREPEHDDWTFYNDAAPTAMEITVPAARAEDGYLILPQEGGVDLQIRIPTCGDVYFSGWNITRFEIEEIK